MSGYILVGGGRGASSRYLKGVARERDGKVGLATHVGIYGEGSLVVFCICN